MVGWKGGRSYDQRPAFEIAAKLALGIGWHGLPFPVVLTEHTESLEILLHHLVQWCLGGTSTGVEARSTVLGRFGGHLEVRNEDRDRGTGSRLPRPAPYRGGLCRDDGFPDLPPRSSFRLGCRNPGPEIGTLQPQLSFGANHLREYEITQLFGIVRGAN
jgi:hypothetical protein